jgi:hypothetical protein
VSRANLQSQNVFVPLDIPSDLSENINAGLRLLSSMFPNSDLTFRPLLIGILPCIALWACFLEIAVNSYPVIFR